MDTFETAKQFFVEGLRFLEANDLQAAETQFAKSLELIPDRVSTLNNLSAVKNRLKKFNEADELATKAVTLDDKSPEAWSNLGFALTRLNRHEEALLAYQRALNCNPSYASAWLYKAMTLLELKKFDEALQTCDQALELVASQYEILYTRSLILKELQRPDDALMAYAKSLDMRVASSPVFAARRSATQKGSILIVSQNPILDTDLRSFESLHLRCLNFPRQVSEVFRDDFQFSFIFECDALKRASRNLIPRPDIVINNVANGEGILMMGSLFGLTEFVDSFGVPVVNHPANVVQTTRDASAKLLDNIPGLVVPRTIRFTSIGKSLEELVREIEQEYDYPMITRTLFAQEGKWMTKVDSSEALARMLASELPEKFFVTQFIDTKGGAEFYRKIRAAIVDDEIIIGRVDYQAEWNVRGRKSAKRAPFYLERPYLLENEKRICANPEKELGRVAVQALEAIRDRIPLDVFGVDFDVNTDGSLVFYEANATMNLFSTAQKSVPNPKEADDALKQAFQRYLASLLSRPRRSPDYLETPSGTGQISP